MDCVNCASTSSAIAMTSGNSRLKSREFRLLCNIPWEPWMLLVDKLLEDEQLLDTVYEAQGERHPQSRIRGRMQTPAEVLLRLLLLKHIRNWSYDVLEREVRANLVYRAFTRIGDEKVPDAKTLARLGQLIEPKVIERLHQRVVEVAQERGVT